MGMDTRTKVFCFLLALLTLAVVSVSVNILRRGRIWTSLDPASRPRRWVLFALLALLGLTFVCLVVFIVWPDTLLARSLIIIWAVAFLGTGFTLRWLSGLVDFVYKRRGR